MDLFLNVLFKFFIEFHDYPKQQQQQQNQLVKCFNGLNDHSFESNEMSPMDLTNEANFDSDNAISKSPIHIYSTSPSSFSCSSSNSSLFSLSNVGFLNQDKNNEDHGDDIMDDESNVDVDEKNCKPEDIKRLTF